MGTWGGDAPSSPDSAGAPAPRPSGGGIDLIRVGVDAVVVDHVRESIENFGERYLDRVFTRHEQESCRGSEDVRARGLAARFAAKEATIKILRPQDRSVPWRAVEVQSHPGGWCDLALSGEAARLAGAADIRGFSMSFTHEGQLAVAVVAAWRGTS